MENFKLKTKNTKVTRITSKACAWMLSIMLVLTGMAPSFAANAKADRMVSGVLAGLSYKWKLDVTLTSKIGRASCRERV